MIISSGVPAVLVTHDAEEAEELGDVVIGYHDGRVTGRRDRSSDPTRRTDVGRPTDTEPT